MMAIRPNDVSFRLLMTNQQRLSQMVSEARILDTLLKARSALANRDLVPRVVSIVCPSCSLDHRSIQAVHGEERFNPNHDPGSGRFSSAAGGGRHEDHPDLKDLAETLKD